MRSRSSNRCAVIAICTIMSATSTVAQARPGHGHGNQQESQPQGQQPDFAAQRQAHQAQQAAQQQAQSAQREQQHNAQQQAHQAKQAAQQQAQSAQHEQQRNARQQGRLNEQAAQQQAQNAQLERQRNTQRQGRRNQQAAQQQAHLNELAAQQQTQNAQREQQRNARQQSHLNEQAAQQQAQNAQLERQRNTQRQGRRNQQAAQQQAHLNKLATQQQTQNAQREQQRSAHQLGRRMDRLTSPIRTARFDQTTRRPSTRRPVTFRNVPLQNAFPLPNFTGRATSAQRARARIAEQNMRAHLIAVPMSLAPSNYARLRDAQLNTYYNDYPFSVNNQQYYINRQNTRYNSVRPSNYPNWYQPDSNWVFSNGFTLGNLINVGLDWLGFGWQPYYGAKPVGFICARNYMPTPWMYESATGQWRQPGLYTYASDGPDEEYTGPITIEVIEQVTDRRGNINNVLYLYNAFYYPDAERWGYENRQGYFIWLDEDARLS